MKSFTRTILITLLVLGFSVQPTHAYFTTNQSALSFPGSHTGLFLIDYSFGIAKHEVLLPVMALANEEKKNDIVSFSIIDEKGNIASGKVTSMVLSNTPLNDTGMYVTPKNSSKKFTLVAFFTPNEYDANMKYRMQVTHLPFNFGGTQQLQLNPSELKYYTTELISL